MPQRNRIFFFSAILLIPLLLGLTPLNMARTLATGCPLANHGRAYVCNASLFHSITSDSDFVAPALTSALLGHDATPSHHDFISESNSIAFNDSLITTPLRC